MVERLAVFQRIFVMLHLRPDAVLSLVQTGNIQGKKLSDLCKIVTCKLAQAAADRSDDLAGCAVGIFIVCHAERQETMPQVSAESIGHCQIDELARACIRIRACLALLWF